MKHACKYNTDLLKGMSTTLRKHFRENPPCTEDPIYQQYCLKHLPYKLRLQYEWEQTTQEQRQQYLDLLNEGTSIGEAYETVGISFEAALEITNRSINTFHYLGRTAE